MATITSAQTGNFSSTSTWVGGVVPTSADDAVAATGHVVTIDTDVTVISFQQAGTGKFVLSGGRTVSGNVIANAGTFTSGGTMEVTATFGNTATINGNLLGVSSTTDSIAGVVVTGLGNLVVNGSVTGSPGNAASSGASILYTNVTCSITVNGSVTGGAGTTKRAVHAGTSSNATINVSATGTVASGASNSHGVFHQGSSGIITVNATTISGGTGAAGHGIHHTGASGIVNASATTFQGGSNTGNAVNLSGANGSCSITGTLIEGGTGGGTHGISHTGASGFISVIATTIRGSGIAFGVNHTGSSGTINITGNIQGGSAAGVYGLSHTGTSGLTTIIGNLLAVGQAASAVRSEASSANSGVVLTGNMTDSSLGAMAFSGRIFRLNATTLGTTTYANNVGYPTGGSVTRVSPDNVTGMPATNNVRKSLTYGYSNQLTGTMAVPAAGSVKFGVPVDNTTGTAELDIGRAAQIIGLQVAAGKSN